MGTADFRGHEADVINEIAARCWQTAEDHGFHEAHKQNPSVKLMLTVDELSEAHEALRDGHDPTETWYREPDGKPEGFGSEIADAIIRELDLAKDLGVTNIGELILEKMAYNDTRPHMHGRSF